MSVIRDALSREGSPLIRAACRCLLLGLLLAPLLAGRPALGAPDSLSPRGLEGVKARGELTWGADAQGGAPYVFPDPRDPGHLIGFEVDLAEALAAKLGVRARLVLGPWDRLLELLERGDFDVALNGLEVTEDKKRVCLLTRPYYAAAERLTVRRGEPGAPHALPELKGRPVGTLPGSLAERILTRVGAQVKTYEGGQDDVYRDLKLGRTDAVLLDEPITQYYGALEPALDVVPGSFGEARYAVAVRRGEESLRDALDTALEELSREGTLRALYERWGLWGAETAALLGDPDPTPREAPEEYLAWRSSVGELPPFWTRVRERYPATLGLFARGALMTLGVSLLSMAVAVAVGLVLALARVFGPRPVRLGALVFTEAVRGTPLLVQLSLVYFGLPQLGVKLSPLVAGVLTLGLNYAAAEAENYRAGLAGVPAGQHEAARVLGLTRWQTLRHVVFPQALRISLPPMTNDFIALLKDSSLVSVVTLTELTRTYLNLANATRDHLGLGALVAVLYLLLGMPFAWLARRVEARLGQHLREAAR